jgi:hypothetical protein
MAKHGTDPVLHELVRAVNESGQARVPVTVSVHGTAVTGVLIAQDAYFAELAKGSPLLSALTPGSGLLGKDYAKAVDSASGEHPAHPGGRPGRGAVAGKPRRRRRVDGGRRGRGRGRQGTVRAAAQRLSAGGGGRRAGLRPSRPGSQSRCQGK